MVGDFVDIMDGLGWNKSEITTGSTIVIRPNQLATDDENGNKSSTATSGRVRRMAMAVDNADLPKELGNCRAMVCLRITATLAPVHPGNMIPNVTRQAV